MVFHPGSQFLRIGFAHEVSTTTVPHVIAIRREENAVRSKRRTDGEGGKKKGVEQAAVETVLKETRKVFDANGLTLSSLLPAAPKVARFVSTLHPCYH